MIKPEMIRPGQIILALSNPNPQITPQDTLAADGRLINNALGFPGIFPGALNAGVSEITYPMLVAAARAIANHTKPGDLIPIPLVPSVHQVVTRAVELTAQTNE